MFSGHSQSTRREFSSPIKEDQKNESAQEDGDKEEEEVNEPIFKRFKETAKFEGKYRYKARRAYRFNYKYREVDPELKPHEQVM